MGREARCGRGTARDAAVPGGPEAGGSGTARSGSSGGLLGTGGMFHVERPGGATHSRGVAGRGTRAAAAVSEQAPESGLRQEHRRVSSGVAWPGTGTPLCRGTVRNGSPDPPDRPFGTAEREAPASERRGSAGEGTFQKWGVPRETARPKGEGRPLRSLTLSWRGTAGRGEVPRGTADPVTGSGWPFSGEGSGPWARHSVENSWRRGSTWNGGPLSGRTDGVL